MNSSQPSVTQTTRIWQESHAVARKPHDAAGFCLHPVTLSTIVIYSNRLRIGHTYL